MTPAIALFVLGYILLRAGFKNQSPVDAALGRDTTMGSDVPAGSIATPTGDTSGDHLASGDLPHGGGHTTPKQVIDQIVIPMAQDHGIHVTPASVEAANHRHSPMTLSGNRSDHNGPPERAWAADMSNGYNTSQEAALARALADRFGIPWSGSGMISHTADGFRYQLGFRTLIGGNHYTHVHFGVRIA